MTNGRGEKKKKNKKKKKNLRWRGEVWRQLAAPIGEGERLGLDS
jgi:hypothetical protein